MSPTSFIRAHFEFSDIFHRSALKIKVTLTLSEEIRESFTYYYYKRSFYSQKVRSLQMICENSIIVKRFSKILTNSQMIGS